MYTQTKRDVTLKDNETYIYIYIHRIMIIMMIALCRPLISNIVAERGRMAEATLRGCIQE